MTDEQIKQKAEAYADVFGRHMVDYYGVKDAFIAGAHSRDEEIKELGKAYHNMFLVLANEVEQLRNPWISVKERLPKKTRELELLEDEHDKVVIVRRRFRETVTAYLDAEEIWRLYPTGRPFYGAITHWMPIPETPKGGEV